MSNVPEIGVDGLADALRRGSPLIDVRQPEEFAEARVPSARLIPLATLGERLDEVPRDATVYVICRSGARSARAVELLRAEGVDAVNVAGGTLAWLETDEPYESDA